MKTDQAQKLLQQLRKEYLSELSQQCDEIENLVLSLISSFQESYAELYRRVHSMKGSAGTHGVTVITTICHNFEEQLNGIEEREGGVACAETDRFLLYVDLIRKARSIALKNSTDFNAIEEALEQVRQQLLVDQYPVMLVESSGYVTLLCKESLSALPLKVTVEDDGLSALGLLLRNRYSLLITANEAKTLNGMALISAIRASDGVNKNIKTILLTSRDSLREEGGIKPDYVVSRNTELAESLPRIVKEIIPCFSKS